MSQTDRLVLSNMIFHARHGVLLIEKRRPQEFRITVELELSLAPAGRSDDLGATIDYRAVQAVVRAVVEGSHRRLIEALAEEIAQRLLREFPRARGVSIQGLKPSPPVDFKLAGGPTIVSRAVRGVVGAGGEGPHRGRMGAGGGGTPRRLPGGFPRAGGVSMGVLNPGPPVDFKFAGVAARIRRQRTGRARRAG